MNANPYAAEAMPTSSDAERLGVPMWVGVHRLGADLPKSVGSTYRSIRLLVLAGEQPVGFVEAPVHRGMVDTAVLERDISILDHTAAPLPEPWEGRISVVVCTRERPAELVGCLDALMAVPDDDVEIVIVDNAPRTDGTAEAVEKAAARDPRVRRVVEPAPGLSRARNRGVAESDSEVIAFTDDDVRVDVNWLRGLRRGFARAERVGLVTGLVPTAEVETPWQKAFDDKVSWSSSVIPTLYDIAEREQFGPIFPYSAGRFGTGANFAVRRAALAEIGGFDPSLGAGARTKGGEDLDAFARVLVHGWRLAFEPTSIAFHVHRATEEDLHRQMFGYGAGLTAYITKLLLDRRTRWDVLRRAPAGAAHLLRARRAGASASVPSSVNRRELIGYGYGPAAYLLERWSTSIRP